MSVLNQSGEEQVECPLCMEPLEVDDLNFFPCTCGYQICRFCWHRIRTDENGLCPACRKAYSEDPADFIPLSQEQVAKLKAEKRQRDQQRKAKLSESRKHLASVRVVQRNLVFVVGLPMRLADAEVLKRHEYFGKFGKIHKVVINQSTAYAGSQGPSASAYVTYLKSDDALRAIQSVNNVTIDGRLIKSSLGTTKYCSHFMKNQPCPKPDCMYLHDFGDPEASFTKEQMHAGKHQEFEKKLHDSLISKTSQTQQLLQQSTNSSVTTTTTTTTTTMATSSTTSSTISTSSMATTTTSTTTTTTDPSLNNNNNHSSNNNNNNNNHGTKSGNSCNSKGKDGGASSTNKENWPQLQNENGKKSTSKGKSKSAKDVRKEKKLSDSSSQSSVKSVSTQEGATGSVLKDSAVGNATKLLLAGDGENASKLGLLDDNSSFFSCNNGFRKIPIDDEGANEEEGGGGDEGPRSPALSDTFPDIGTVADWAAAFGLPKSEQTSHGSPQQRHDFGREEPFGRYEMTFFDSLGKEQQQSYNHHQSGLDQHMSKFFMDFHHKQNGYAPQHSAGNNGFLSDHERFIQQKKLEEHLIGLNSPTSEGKSRFNGGQQNGYYQQNHQQQGYQSHQHQQQGGKRQARALSEDELDFDPFQETQKAFAELMANEENYKTSHLSASGGTRTNQMNGLVHSNHQGGGSVGHLPPPPPGFVQTNTAHMNSFGSKILPFLNMSNNSQQQQQQISPTQNWSTFNGIQHTQQQPQQHKGLNGCNDWKDFDSAIVTTRRPYPFSVSPMRDFSLGSHNQMSNGGSAQLAALQQPQQQQMRPQDYMSNAFSNFAQQLQQQQQPTTNGFNMNGYSTTQQPSGLWYGSELNSQISSPPGFRSTNQTSKQQEC